MPASRITGTCDRLAQEGDVVGVADTQATPDGRPQGHDGGAADLLQAEGQYGVVGRVGQDDEPVVDQLLGGGQELDRVGKKGAIVADHLQLHPVGGEGLAGQLGRQHGLAGGEAPGGVGQHPHADLGQQVEQRPLARGIDPAHRDRGQRRARLDQRLAQGAQARHPTGPQEQAGRERLAGDAQRLGLR